MATPEVGAGLHALAEQALAAWDLVGAAIKPVSVSENITFRVDKAGAAYVLRIHRPGYHSLAELQSEHVWTNSLIAAGLDVPVPLRTVDGEGYITLPYAGGVRNIGVLRWEECEVLGGIIERHPERVTRHFRQIGAIAAAVHNQSSGWPLPAGFKRHSFDVDGLMGPDPFWGRFWEMDHLDEAGRALVVTARDRIAQTLGAYGKAPQTYSLIHADLHPYNVVIGEGEGEGECAGEGEGGLHVIDFDDAGFGWHHYELAVALYNYRRHEAFEDIQAALIEGYRNVRPLADEVVDMLPMFFLIRTLVSLGWRQQRPEHGTDLAKPVADACQEAAAWLAHADNPVSPH
jgi:Ser/Thr protein kinase RdoA (MazF antagonist)